MGSSCHPINHGTYVFGCREGQALTTQYTVARLELLMAPRSLATRKKNESGNVALLGAAAQRPGAGDLRLSPAARSADWKLRCRTAGASFHYVATAHSSRADSSSEAEFHYPTEKGKRTLFCE